MWKFQEFLCGFFSRTLAFIFTYGFLKKFSRTHFCFHGQFFRNFHGRKINFTDGKPKIVENFHGRHFDFHGEKRKRWKVPPLENYVIVDGHIFPIGELSLWNDLSASHWLECSHYLVLSIPNSPSPPPFTQTGFIAFYYAGLCNGYLPFKIDFFLFYW